MLKIVIIMVKINKFILTPYYRLFIIISKYLQQFKNLNILKYVDHKGNKRTVRQVL